MKFINYLEKITHVDIIGITSFLIFFTFFIIMAFWAMSADKKLITTLSELPLNDAQEN